MGKSFNEIAENKINTLEVPIFEVRDTCAFIYVNGWIAYLPFSNPKLQSKELNSGNMVTIKYEGDLEKDTDGCFNLKILPLE